MGVVGILELDLHIFEAQSLKERRFVLRSLKDSIRKHHNASVAEVGGGDKWQRAELLVSVAGIDQTSVRQTLDRILKRVDSDHRVEVLEKNFSWA